MGRGPYQVEDFVGQKRALRAALRLQDGATMRGEPAPHMLFEGPSGCGKSMAALTLGVRAGTTVIKFNGKTSVEEIAGKLAAMKACDIAFFDECHNLPGDPQELLFTVIDANELPAALVPGAKPDEPVTVAPITLIFATDRPGKLLNALQKRIPLKVEFEPYALDEMKEIVARIGTRRGILLSAQAAGQLAQVCHGLPRRAEHHVNNLRLTFADSEQRQLGIDDVRVYLDEIGMDADGLDRSARKYLKFLRRNESASAEAIAAFLGTDIDNLKNQIEQPLRFRGLVTVGSGGRTLTEKGTEWAEQRKARQTKGDNRG